MKQTLKEAIREFKRLTTEATSTASSGAYEQPLGYKPAHVCSVGCPNPCPHSKQNLVGSEISYDAPAVDVVDITAVAPTVDAVGVTPDTSLEPEGWEAVGFDYDFTQHEANSMDEYFNEGEFEDEEEEGVFTSLEMFTETTKGIGW
tara:strand:+ start:8312 stop:8749 length:438 start_codon:yes stop_codon:yes gene_type:complete